MKTVGTNSFFTAEYSTEEDRYLECEVLWDKM